MVRFYYEAHEVCDRPALFRSLLDQVLAEVLILSFFGLLFMEKEGKGTDSDKTGTE